MDSLNNKVRVSGRPCRPPAPTSAGKPAPTGAAQRNPGRGLMRRIGPLTPLLTQMLSPLYDCMQVISASTSMISTLAGTGAAGFNLESGPAPTVQLNAPGWVALRGLVLWITDAGRMPTVEMVARVAQMSLSKSFLPLERQRCADCCGPVAQGPLHRWEWQTGLCTQPLRIRLSL